MIFELFYVLHIFVPIIKDSTCCNFLSLYFFRYVAELEKSIVSVERVKEYQSTPQEAAFEIPDLDPPTEWPQFGEIIFEDYATRYRQNVFLRYISRYIDRSPAILTSDDFLRSNEIIRTKWPIYVVIGHFVLMI